jgi:hypothetical protein
MSGMDQENSKGKNCILEFSEMIDDRKEHISNGNKM